MKTPLGLKVRVQMAPGAFRLRAIGAQWAFRGPSTRVVAQRPGPGCNGASQAGLDDWVQFVAAEQALALKLMALRTIGLRIRAGAAPGG